VTQLKLDSIWETLDQLRSLKRFKWTISGRINVGGVLPCLAAAAGNIRSMKSCHLRFVRFTDDSDAVQEEFFQNGTQLLENIVEIKPSSCTFIVTTNLKKVFQMRPNPLTFENTPLDYRCDWKLRFFPFITTHGLPIEFRFVSTEEQEDV
jgi:hypothetical protein